MEAYDRYLEARGLIAQRVDFPRIITLLNEATRLDPQFAEGWAANAQAHTLAPYYIGLPRQETSETAESMAVKALEINPDLSMAHSVLGDVYRDRFEWKKATDSYMRALALNPDDIEANEQYAQMLWRASYFDEALKYSTRAVELDPLSWLNLTVHATLRYAAGDRTGGWADMVRALEMCGDNRDFPSRHAINMSLSEGKIERAIDIVKTLADSPDFKAKSPSLNSRYEEFIPLLDSREQTLEYLANNIDSSMSVGVVSPWALDLFWAAYYGDYELAEEIMVAGTALDQHLGILDTSWFNYPIINPLRNTESYKDLVRRINLDDFWRDNGFPANCRPIGDDDFACN
jgi:Tfp pilus assembly protein PilF